jgi:hypothetical protein
VTGRGGHGHGVFPGEGGELSPMPGDEDPGRPRSTVPGPGVHEGFGVRERPGISPGRPAWVGSLQLAGDLTTRQAAHAVRGQDRRGVPARCGADRPRLPPHRAQLGITDADGMRITCWVRFFWRDLVGDQYGRGRSGKNDTIYRDAVSGGPTR